MGRNSLPRRPSRAHLLGSAFPPFSSELLSLVAAASLAMAAGPAFAGPVLPTGGSVAAGSANIGAPTSNALTVSQSSQRAIINWGSFSIGAGGTVLFNNGSGATLNRVTGNMISQIDGSLKATGSVYLINPQGIVIGPSGQVITNGSFVASTRDVSNNAFMSGSAFAASGTSNGSIINQGVITSNTGDAILVGASVTNTGAISAPNGTVGLAAGNEITLQPIGSDSRISISGGMGSVTNSGNLKAAQAELNAAGGNVYALAENNGGVISATGTQTINGHVWLTAGGTVRVAGNVAAQNANGSGGDVTVRGYDIALPGAINASATNANGAGGTVSIVAANNTTVTGSVAARGGASGAGGAVETSGHSLAIGGAKIDAGQGGNWLLDPYNLTVDSTAASTIDTSLNAGTSVLLKTTASGTSGPGIANASGNGDIYINSAINWGTSATLTLDAYHSIFVNAPITVTAAGGIVIKTNDGGSGGDYSFGLGPTGFAGSINYGSTNNGGTLTINGTAYTLLYSMGDVQNINSNLGGHYALGTSLDASNISNWIPIGYSSAVSSNGSVPTYGPFTGVNATPTRLSGIFDGLGNTISNLTIDNTGADNLGLFSEIGSTGVVRNVGLLNGNLTAGGGYQAFGLLAGWNLGTIESDYATGSVNGVGNVNKLGGLVGWNWGGTVSNSYAAVNVTGGNGAGDVGGLVGGQGYYLNGGGEIIDSYATGNVTAGMGSGPVGGLAGENNSAVIRNSYATGNVTTGSNSDSVGGLAGTSNGYWGGDLIAASYATGIVSGGEGSTKIGGLIGSNSWLATVTDSYATGNVSGGDAVGGLVGWNGYGLSQAIGAYISTSYSTGHVSGENNVGGLVGFNNSGTITSGYFDSDNNVGLSGIGGDNNNQSGNVTGLTTAQMMTASELVGFSFGTTGGASGWVIIDTDGSLNNAGGAAGGTYPILLSEYSTTITNAHQLQLMELNLSAAYTLGGNINASGTAGGDVWGAQGFIPVGSDATPFGGSLHGNGNTIDALTINSPSEDFVGLFGDMGSGVVDNLNLTNVSITGQSEVGGIAGLLAGTVTNSSTTGSVTGVDATAGGLVGYNAGAISNSYSTASVSGGTYLGGLVGENVVGGTITHSYASGLVTGGNGVGGAVGFNNGGALTDVNAYGNVTGTDYVGGLVGENTDASASIESSYAEGSVTGTNYVGGLAGSNDPGSTIDNSGASGSVAGSQYVGGLAGENDGSITNDAAAADISLNSAVGQIGGLVGYNSSTGSITGSSSTGNVAAVENATYVGGLVGENSGSISQSSSNVTVVSQTDVGGLVGWNTASGTITQSNVGSGEVCGCGSAYLEGSLNVGGLVGWNQGSITNVDATVSVYTIAGGTVLGGLVGLNDTTGTISNASTENANVSGNSIVGGMIGTNAGSFMEGAAANDVSGNTGTSGSSTDIGGFVGNNLSTGTIQLAIASGTATGAGYVGGFAGENAGSITDVGAAVTVMASLTTTSTTGVAGGLVGMNDSTGTITGSYATGTVSGYEAGGLVGYNSGSVTNSWAGGDVTGTGDIGGLIGDNASTVSYVYALGDVTGPANNVGGLVGSNLTGGSVSEAYATGAVSNGTNIGGLIGSGASGTTLNNAYWDSYTTGQGAAIGSGPAATNTNAVSANDGTAYAQASYANFDFTGGAAHWFIIDGQTRPFLTGEAWNTGGSNYVIVNAHQLQLMAMNLNGNYQLTGGGKGNPFLDASATGAGTGSNMWTDAGFVPVGSDSTPFTGTLDGASGAIDSLYISRPSEEFVGLFGDVGGSGTVENVNLTNVFVTGEAEVGGIAGLIGGTVTNDTAAGSVDGGAAVGGLVGYNIGAISDSSSSASVSGSAYIGGLVGNNDTGGTITGSSASGTVSGVNAVGGLVGRNLNLITQSYASGDVSTVTDDAVLGTGVGDSVGAWAGGLVGLNGGGMISDSYATGTVLAGYNAGGLVGENSHGNVEDSYASGAVSDAYSNAGGLIGKLSGGGVINAYALGSVTGSDDVGGLIGLATGGVVNHGYASGAVSATSGTNLGGIVGSDSGVTISNVYWDEGTTGQTSAGAGFTGTATAVGGTSGLNPYAQSSYSGLSTNGHWLFVAGVRPMLAMEYSTTITNGHQLQLMATNISANYTLANDIDLSGTGSGSDVWSPAGFVPIYLAGSLDGQNFTIFNLYEYNPSSNTGTGLFARIFAGATVQNLSLAEADVTGGNFVGALAGSNQGLIQNVTVGSSFYTYDSTVTGGTYVGGLVGANMVGGQIGTTYGPENDVLGLTGGVGISNVVVTGGQGVGGVAGWNAGSMSGGSDFGQSAAAAVVSGTSQVGGFVGWNTGSIDSALAAVETVTGSGFGIGGIVGYNAASGSITNSFAADANFFSGLTTPATTGVIGGSGSGMGGVVGLNAGTIGGSQDVFLTIGSASTVTSGGFAAQNTGTIEDSAAQGATVNGSINTGGFVGYNTGLIAGSGSIEAFVTGVQRAGGFAGVNAAGGIIADSSSDGAVIATGNRIGGFVGWNAGTLDGSVDETGNTTDATVSGGSQVGGLVGWNDGTITQASASGDVTASGFGGGGLVGFATATSNITDSYATGSVGGTAGDLGGLVGQNAGSITNAYATGDVGVATTNNSGGLIGYNTGTVSDVYATGTVLGTQYITGALVGNNAATGNVSDAYYVSTVNGALPGVGTNKGTFHATAMGGVGQPDPTAQATYIGFDFTDVWTIESGGMPTLRDAP